MSTMVLLLSGFSHNSRDDNSTWRKWPPRSWLGYPSVGTILCKLVDRSISLPSDIGQCGFRGEVSVH